MSSTKTRLLLQPLDVFLHPYSQELRLFIIQKRIICFVEKKMLDELLKQQQELRKLADSYKGKDEYEVILFVRSSRYQIHPVLKKYVCLDSRNLARVFLRSFSHGSFSNFEFCLGLFFG